MLEFLVLSFIWTLCLSAGDNKDQCCIRTHSFTTQLPLVLPCTVALKVLSTSIKHLLYVFMCYEYF